MHSVNGTRLLETYNPAPVTHLFSNKVTPPNHFQTVLPARDQIFIQTYKPMVAILILIVTGYDSKVQVPRCTLTGVAGVGSSPCPKERFALLSAVSITFFPETPQLSVVLC